MTDHAMAEKIIFSVQAMRWRNRDCGDGIMVDVITKALAEARAAVWREIRDKLYADPWPNAIQLRVWVEQQAQRGDAERLRQGEGG